MSAMVGQRPTEDGVLPLILPVLCAGVKTSWLCLPTMILTVLSAEVKMGNSIASTKKGDN